jgi:di/tricarboxylate transporter
VLVSYNAEYDARREPKSRDIQQFMSYPEIYLTVVIIIALLLIVTERLRPDLVALMVLLALGVPHIISPENALSGFSRSAVITLMGLFIITAGLDRTGVTRLLADNLLRVGRGSEKRLVFLFTVSAALLSLFMNNIAAGAVLLPAAVNVSRRTQIPSSKLLMPMSFGTLLGGMATFFTTANILVSTALKDQGLESLNVFDFTPTGGVVAIAGIIYLVFIGRRLLPVRTPVGQYAPRKSAPDLEKVYELSERLWEAEVMPKSPLAELTLAESCIGERLGVNVVAIWHGRIANLTPEQDDILHAGDMVLIAGREDRVSALAQEGMKIGRSTRGTINGNGNSAGQIRRSRVRLAEVIVAPHSMAEGKSLKDLNFRKKYGVTAVALWRDGRSYRTDVGTMPLCFGDALLMVGEPQEIDLLRSEEDFIVLEGESTPIQHPQLAPIALLITVVVLLLAATNVLAIAEAMLLGAVLMVLTGCLTMDDSYRAIEWRAIFLVAGMLPISIAMTETGLAARLGQGLIALLGPMGPLAVIAGLYVLSVLLSQVMSGQVTALVIAPIAISAALQIGTSPQAACLAVAIACSTSFLTPIAHPVNVLVMGPGGYTFRDFFKVGWLLTVVCFVALLIALPLFWKL